MGELVRQESTGATTREPTRGGATYTPRCDIVETQNELLLWAELPGVAPDDLDLRFENGQLEIIGHVPRQHEGDEPIYSEYGIGDFYRAFTLGETIDSEKISAELKHGILAVHLPKTEAAKPRKIEIKTS